MSRRWFRLGLTAVIVVIDILLGGWVSWWHIVCWPTLLAVLVVTITEGLTIGSVGALVSGVVIDNISAVQHPVHTIGFVVAAVTAWMITRRVVTSRSTISLVTAVAVGTVAYGFGAGVSDWMFSSVIRERLHLQLSALLVSTASQTLVHPLVVVFIWRIFGRGRYGRLTHSLAETF